MSTPTLEQALTDAEELRYLLRQVLYARGPGGTKFIDELAGWKLDDLKRRLVKAVNVEAP